MFVLFFIIIYEKFVIKMEQNQCTRAPEDQLLVAPIMRLPREVSRFTIIQSVNFFVYFAFAAFAANHRSRF